MSKIQCVFKRVEKKYVISNEQYEALIKSIEKNMSNDLYGEYTICNIYFDNDNFDLIRNSIEKPLFKEKLRLRSYGVPGPDTIVFLEIKRKFKGTVYKRRVALKYSEIMDYLNNGKRPECDLQVLNEIDYIINLYNLSPKVFLAYDRQAFKGNEDETLRITFDRNIRSRECDLELIKGDYGDFLLDDEERVMEIKTASAMPLWLCDELSRLKIYPTSFSKYGRVFKEKIINSGGN